jgi:DNA-binding CsgD family transcriptional regulator
VLDYLEAWMPSGIEVVALEGEQVTIGSDPSNAVAVMHDPTVSRLHAVLSHYGPGWCVRDLDSRNGTYVNGERISSERPLLAGDELRVGNSRLIFRGGQTARRTMTQADAPPPLLTRRERDVLVALCRPLGSGQRFVEPASIRAIAAELVVTEGAVKQHLLRLYDKFEITGRGERRRVQLANQAIARGAVKMTELRPVGAH